MKNLFFIIPVLAVSAGFQRENNNTRVTSGPIPVDGKIHFASQPFTAGTEGKTSFTSAEYIYGKIELTSATIKEAFKIKEDENKPASLRCRLNILKGGEVIHYGTSRDYVLVKEESKNSRTLLLDIMPEAAKATTLYSMLEDFSAGFGFNPLAGLIKNGQLPTGDYRIRITVYTETVNAYGSLQSEDKWPTLEGEFDLRFSEDDVANILANSEKLREIVVENAFRYDKLPDVFSKPGKLTDPNATQAKIAAILKRDLPKRQILKWVAESYDGPYWHIAKDDFGLPRYKYFNPHIWMAYKIDGKCYVGSVTLRQVYSGGGTYGPLQVAYTSAGSVPDKGIDCTRVK